MCSDKEGIFITIHNMSPSPSPVYSTLYNGLYFKNSFLGDLIFGRIIKIANPNSSVDRRIQFSTFCSATWIDNIDISLFYT